MTAEAKVLNSGAAARRAGVTWSAAIILLAGFVALAVRMAWTTSATFDEPGFIVAGYSYQHPRGPQICTTNLRLVPLWLAAPGRFLGPKLPAALVEHPGSNVTGDINLGRAFLADPRNDGTALLRVSRCANILLGVVLGTVLFVWSRRIHGDAGALLTLGLFCLNPVIIANSAIATTDLGTALLFVISVGVLWRLLHRVTPGNVVGCGIAIGALAAAKLSWFVVLPIAAVLVLLRRFSPAALELQIGSRPFPARHRAAALLGAGIGVATVAYATVWLVYGFRFTPGQPLPPEAWFADLRGPPTLFQRTITALRDARLLPEGYLFDMASFASSGGGRRAFLAGNYSIDGWWYFFPVVWFLKSPLSFLVALLLAAAATFASHRATPRFDRRSLRHGLLPLAVLGGIYLLVAMAGPLNIGIRHLLPVYPVLFVLAAGVVGWPAISRRLRLAGLAGLLGWSATEAASVHPEYLAYINVFGGGARNGYRVLADSSYDWGQDLPAFEHWLNARATERPAARIYFSYFGNAELARFSGRAVLLPQYIELRPITAYPLGAGTYVISATMLDTLFGPLMGPWRPSYENQYQGLAADLRRLETALGAGGRAQVDMLMAQEGVSWWQERILLFDHFRFARLCAMLRHREPSSRITRTLLVYELDDDDLRAALLGPPAEMREDYRVKGDALQPGKSR